MAPPLLSPLRRILAAVAMVLPTHRIHRTYRSLRLVAILLSLGVCAWSADALPSFDFTQSGGTAGWTPAHDISRLDATGDGLRAEITGNDPYIMGPPRDYPADQPLFIHLRLRSEQPGMCQIFYFTDHATEADSIRLPARGGGKWEELEGVLPPLGPHYRLRIDPPGDGGSCVLAQLSFTVRTILKEPAWPQPRAPDLPASNTLTLTSGDLELQHAATALGAFVVRVHGQDMAHGHTPLFGCLAAGACTWDDVAATAATDIRLQDGCISVTTVAPRSGGGRWFIGQTFSAGKEPGAINVETRLGIRGDAADIVYAPLLTLLPGAPGAGAGAGAGTTSTSFGPRKGQALFAGVEYLDDEPSSSEADLIGPAARRQVPDTLKLTFPLMALQAQGRYLGLVWDLAPDVSALFDSPDRIFHGGGHVLGLSFPGSDGRNRIDGSLLPHRAQRLDPGATLVLRATIIAGLGDSIVPAVQHCIRLRGLPPPPKPPPLQEYVALAAAGWLDSGLGDGAGLYRHAAWPGFQPQSAADAAVLMDWLASRTDTPVLAERLRQASRAALARVPPRDYSASGIGHVRCPVGSLCYGQVAENAERAAASARAILAAFEADGSILYRQRPGGPDYARTNPAREANGLTAERVWALLEQACFAGDQDLLHESLQRVRQLHRYDRTVPRGAQTWECPLHTPDILAAAHLVRAYTRAFELTGDQDFLDHAAYWAWTGVPFVYLRPPTDQPVGAYGTIAVLGATNWQAPVWMGLPVQWCGLVYADGLYRLARHLPQGPWLTLARGITACGMQMTWPLGDQARRGLLPDSYLLRQQLSDGPPINPGTLQAEAIHLYAPEALYDFHASRLNRWYVHAPGTLASIADGPGSLSFSVRSWMHTRPYQVLVSGLGQPPQLRIDGVDTPVTTPHQYLPASGRLILCLQGQPHIELRRAKDGPAAR